MRPIPNPQARLLDGANTGNFSLYFSRMTEWQDKGEIRQDAIEQLGARAKTMLVQAGRTLESIHSRQTDALLSVVGAGGMVLVWQFKAQLSSPFVSGLGSGHPTETGMILDRNSGLPYIPASAVKGALRLACALEIMAAEPNAAQPKGNEYEINDRHPRFRRYFGDTDTSKADSCRGQLVFLDAFPAAIPTMKTDIMNPHFGEYYKGNREPLDTESPIPVKFLAVKEKATFVFRCFAQPLPCRDQGEWRELTRPFDAQDDDWVRKMFSRALTELGLGGKTAVGYGRFATPEILATDHFKELAEDKRQQRQREEDERLHPWKKPLAEVDHDQISDWDTLKKKLLENQAILTHKEVKEVAEAVKEAALRVKKAKPEKWDSKRDQVVSEWLQSAGIAWSEGTNNTGIGGQATVDAGTVAPESNRIKAAGYKDWGVFKQKNPDMDAFINNLTLAEAQNLKQLFQAWKIKDGKDDKKKGWKMLEKRLKNLEKKTAI
jgi:CRISPR-associated protein Cmr6